MAQEQPMTEQVSNISAGYREDAKALLREFLANRDSPCPVCRVNVRGVSDAVCPRCGTRLALALHPSPPRFGWFLVLLAPLIVTWGLLAFVLLHSGATGLPIIASPGPCLLALVAAIDVLVAVAIWEQRDALLAAPPARQRAYAVRAWSIHIVLGLLSLVVPSL